MITLLVVQHHVHFTELEMVYFTVITFNNETYILCISLSKHRFFLRFLQNLQLYLRSPVFEGDHFLCTLMTLFVSRSCNIIVRNLSFVLFSCENEHFPLK